MDQTITASPRKKRSQIYRDAAQVLRDRGWCKYSYCDPKGRMCLAGAVFAAAGGTVHPQISDYEIRDPKFMPLLRGLERFVGYEADFDSIEDFNNNECKTRKDAVALLELAGDYYEGAGK